MARGPFEPGELLGDYRPPADPCYIIISSMLSDVGMLTICGRTIGVTERALHKQVDVYHTSAPTHITT